MDLIAIGRIVGVHGIKGEVKVEILTDFPERFSTTKHAFLCDEADNSQGEVQFEAARPHKNVILLKLVGYDDRTKAASLRGLYLTLPKSELVELAEDEHFLYQLIGMAVIDQQDGPLGQVTDVLTPPANDVYVVMTPDSQELLIPAIPDVVLDINEQDRVITVAMLKVI